MVLREEQPLNHTNIPLRGPHLEKTMFWLHCNGCYCQPEPGVVLRFFITNCSHIYCEKCVTECTKECCKVCQSQCTTLELSGKLQKEVENLFDEPVNIFQRAMKQVNQTIEFQKSHQRRWCRHLKEVVKQQTVQLKDVKKLVAQYRILEKEIMELKKENSYLKCILSKSDPGIRSGSRSGNYPAASPTQLIFGRNAQYPVSINQLQANKSGSSSSNILNQPGRILMRTPPSVEKSGTTRSRLSYMTPGSIESMVKPTRTPLSVPRPIYISQTND